ncbi:hypothetical protein [Butyrivibrio fibrisolvens]|uniref:hypothetical protein n=1 Tax=Butyrivibrio fibrisolvens TaxID=831 RepID=UPI0003B4B224|nr:hypothetical protein [Butyrivibrio fibrisolvens]
MKSNSDIRVCKNKECQKILPPDYKHKYCEACRNKHAQMAKNAFKGIGAGVAGAAGIALVFVTGGRFKK